MGGSCRRKGRKRTIIAILGPFVDVVRPPRKLGLLAKRGKPVFKNWELSEEDFLVSRL